MNTREAGARYEAQALAHLQASGLRLIARNVTYRQGELDLVMHDGATVVFVEVRYRRRADAGSGAESVGAAKRAKLIRAAGLFLAAHPALARQPCRFDVVSLGGDASEVDWRRAAFDSF